MKKTNGQALVEFILILPVFFLLVFGAIDFGTILYEKYRLQNDLDVIHTMYEQNRIQDITNYGNKNHLNITYQEQDTYSEIIVSKPVSVTITRIFKNPYQVKESIRVLRETQP